MRTPFWVAGLGFIMLAGAIASFGAGAPAVLGAPFLVAMVACGVIALVLMLRVQSQARGFARSVQQRKAPWRE